MLELVAALAALRDTGTTARAATRLRITQSAVSKRLATLEAAIGAELVERIGRGSRLTPAGERLLADAAPLLAQLRDVVASASGERPAPVRVAASESLLCSWLPDVLARVRGALGTELELHAHRGPTLLARVASGEADVAIAVDSVEDRGLVSVGLGREPMVLVPAGRAKLDPSRAGSVDAWTIEERSLTWTVLAPALRRREPPWGFHVRITGRLESFTALARVALAGFANALVPRGVALASGVREGAIVPLPGLERPLALVTRRRALERPAIAAFLRELRRAWPP